MAKLITIDDYTYRKQTTQADFLTSTGILIDRIVPVEQKHIDSRIVPTGFKYSVGDNSLEVYLNGQYVRNIVFLDSIPYGEYEEYTAFSVRFSPGILSLGDTVRFRVTAANYSGIFTEPGVAPAAADLENVKNGLNELGKEVFGNSYVFSFTGLASNRQIGIMTVGDQTPDLSNFRTWKTPNTSATWTITNFDNCFCDDIKNIIWQTSPNIEIQHNSNIRLQGGQDFSGGPGDTMQLIFDGSIWYELNRSLNG